MKIKLTWICFATGCALIAGCAKTRSISNSNYESRGRHSSDFQYRGELSEFDVLGINPDENVSEEDIRNAQQNGGRPRLRRGSTILLVQSGATFPDGMMANELGKYFRVVPFTGVPVERKDKETSFRSDTSARSAAVVTDGEKPTVTVVPLFNSTSETKISEAKEKTSYSRSLRLAAARGGADVIVCYWGMLESANEKMPTKTVSWVPIVNWMLPHEREHMRIQLKVALIDVRSGSWSVFSPQAFDDKKISISPRREVADQKLVQQLKEKVYENAARELTQAYLN